MKWLPCGTYLTRYDQENVILRGKHQGISLLVFLFFLFTLPFYSSRYFLSLICMVCIAIIVVEGLGILTGFAGQISIGQAAFMGLGAYITAYLTGKTGLSFLPALVLSGLGTGFIGLVFGLPALRVKGFYLAMTTLAAQLILGWVFLHAEGLTGGMHGAVVEPARIFGYSFHTLQAKYVLILAITCLMVFIAKNLMRSRLGRALVAVRDNDLAANVMGININIYKLVAFFIANIFAGVAGSMWAHFTGFVNVDQFILNDSIIYLGMLIIGGMGSIMGPIFGVIFLKIIEECSIYFAPIASSYFPAIGAQFFAALLLAVYAMTIVLFLVLEPRGINHQWNMLKNKYRLFPFSY